MTFPEQMHDRTLDEISEILASQADPLKVRQTTAALVTKSQFVFINRERLDVFTNLLRQRVADHQLLDASQFGASQANAQLVFLEDVVNFCFWARRGEPKWTVEYPRGNFVGGWLGLAACFGRAINEGIPILDPHYLICLTMEEAQRIFRGSNQTQIPLLDKRLENLREAGRVLMAKFAGSFENLLSQANFEAPEIARLLIENFSSFKDQVVWDKNPIYFYKRAQICAYDLSMLPQLEIYHLDQLTAFADYKLPQILRATGVLQYSPELANRIDKMEIIPAASLQEIEIRAATIWACELISKKIGQTATTVDNAIWVWAQQSAQTGDMPAHHRTLSTNY